MKIDVPVNHNFYEEAPIRESALSEAFGVKRAGIRQLKELFSSVHELKLGSEQLKKVKIFNFKRKRFEPDDERLMLRLYAKEKPKHEKEYFIQTGLYAGILFYKGCKINITCKYGDAFLRRMLNFVNDVYVDSEKVGARQVATENPFLFIIAYLFIQSLEKSAVLGLPQEYRKHRERSPKVRGTVDFNDFLKRDVPFQGNLTSTFRERMYVQEIIDVLYLALRKLEKVFGKEIYSRLIGLNQLLGQHYSGRFVSHAGIQQARTHRSINNPMYSGFKKVLEYAEVILLDKDLIPEDGKHQLAATGYLFDIADLYELYLEKLLGRNFPEWAVGGQEELPIYQHQFYKRSMFPDLVMRHKQSGRLVVFDAKFKRMEFINSDVDRADLHQMHAYIAYFGEHLIASGLIYPLLKEVNANSAYSKSVYGIAQNNIRFIVDGIYIFEDPSMKELIRQEDAFISRIASIINTN